MKNILILVLVLFLTSFSFIGCSDDPVESITGPTPIVSTEATITIHGVPLEPGQHIDMDKDGHLIVCPVGNNGEIFHTRLGGQYDGMCVDEDGYLPYGKTPEGCGPRPDNYYANPDGCSLTISDMGCYTPTELENFLNSLAPGFCPS